jgi:hypothetical protein
MRPFWLDPLLSGACKADTSSRMGTRTTTARAIHRMGTHTTVAHATGAMRKTAASTCTSLSVGSFHVISIVGGKQGCLGRGAGSTDACCRMGAHTSTAKTVASVNTAAVSTRASRSMADNTGGKLSRHSKRRNSGGKGSSSNSHAGHAIHHLGLRNKRQESNGKKIRFGNRL